jgi:stage II sporulation protein D
MSRARRPAIQRTAAILAALLGLGVTVVASAPAATAETLIVAPAGSFKVTSRGNGHGHGMSQYGARGAAIAGKTYQQIAAFYYPGTTLATVSSSATIRVRLSAPAKTTTIAAFSHTAVTGVAGDLPIAGISKYRLEADGRGLTLQKLGKSAGSTWTNVKAGLASGAEFHRTNRYSMRQYHTDGSSTFYYGYLRAVRVDPTDAAKGVYTVNRVSYDRYTQGVVPQEMPASWQRAAVDAQAVAARSYGAYAVAHAAASAAYDICDTSQCQVYGGHAGVDAAGNVTSTDYAPAAADTANKVLTYQGGVIFAQFSASDGGWTVAGGQPYLPAKADPYETAASGDPYLNAVKTVKVAAVAKAFGLKTVTKIVVGTRDGHGLWGGRVLAGSVQGKDSAGHAVTVSATGSDFAGAFGLGTTWFTCSSASA